MLSEIAPEQRNAEGKTNNCLAFNAFPYFWVPTFIVGLLAPPPYGKVHWVSGWEGERYSVVFFSINPSRATPVRASAEHKAWMESRCAAAAAANSGNEAAAANFGL